MEDYKIEYSFKGEDCKTVVTSIDMDHAKNNLRNIMPEKIGIKSCKVDKPARKEINEPKEVKTESKKLIFLDVDGVLNCQQGYKEGYNEYTEFGNEFYPPSKDLLNRLIEETKADIVISSTWRHSGLEVMKEMWKHREMSGKIIGITPTFKSIKGYSIPRGCEINYFLEKIIGLQHVNWSEELQQTSIDVCGYDNYIIIDDDSDMLYQQRNHFVHVLPSPRNISGFNKEYFEIALEKLNKTIIDLNYKDD